MNENIVHVVNFEILVENKRIMIRRKNLSFLSEESQRIKIISELTELFDSYNTFGSEYMTDIALSFFKQGDIIEASRAYVDTVKDTMSGELADVFLATLSLKSVIGEEEWISNKNRTKGATTFMKMISQIAEGLSADAVLDWCLSCANSHSIDLGKHLTLKLFYNEHRKDW